jgi:hypothetical protein
MGYESGEQPAATATPAPATVIELGHDLAKVVDEGADALSSDSDIYKRNGELARIVRVDASKADDAQREGTPQIRSIPAATLKARLTKAAKWVRKTQDKETKEWKHTRTVPNDDVVAAISQHGEWPKVRRLVGIIETPAMREDGTILQERGYDSATAFVYEPGAVNFPKVPEHPTREQAFAALQELFEPFADFPFASAAAAMVPIAAILTLLARSAIQGNVPAFIFEANTRGSGKTKLGDVVAMVATGRKVSKVTFPRTDDELEKLLGGYARKGAALFSFDNISLNTPFGGAPLDKVLTSGGTVDLRILGQTVVPSFEWRAVVMASGNNVAYQGDTTRRVLLCRLESPLENPEDRENFLHPDLLEWVETERARLAVAGLTILRGYVAAGRPTVEVKTWGSFEAWSSLVPRAIVWAAGDASGDPQLTRPTLDETAEPEKNLLERLLVSFPPGQWRVRDLIEGKETGSGGRLPFSAELTDVMQEIAPSNERDRAGIVGRALRGWKGRVVGGRRLVSKVDRKRLAHWSVESA